MAYTGAITVCSARSMTEFSPQWTSGISIGLSLVTLFVVAWNYKGAKTLVACATILAGIFFIAQSELVSGLLTQYYAGCAMLFLGVWMNASFSWFVRLIYNGMFQRLIPHG